MSTNKNKCDKQSTHKTKNEKKKIREHHFQQIKRSCRKQILKDCHKIEKNGLFIF